MKNVIKTIVLGVVLMACGTTANAQMQGKIAYLYSDSLIAIMPEAKKADSAVQKFVQKYETEIAKREEALNKKQKEIQDAIAQNGGKEPTDAIFELNRQDFEDQYKKYMALQEDAQTQVAKKRQELYAPIIETAKKAIAEVAKEKGYIYVIDASLGALLYSLPENNILDEVKKKLGIK